MLHQLTFFFFIVDFLCYPSPSILTTLYLHIHFFSFHIKRLTSVASFCFDAQRLVVQIINIYMGVDLSRADLRGCVQKASLVVWDIITHLQEHRRVFIACVLVI